MILLDTNVVVDAMDKVDSHTTRGGKSRLRDAVVGEGGGISVVTLAELCAGARNPEDVEPEVRLLGTTRLRHACCGLRSFVARAYRRYVISPATFRRQSATEDAAARLLHRRTSRNHGLEIATRHQDRFKNYFPTVPLLTP